jgi:hypothetical protein
MAFLTSCFSPVHMDPWSVRGRYQVKQGVSTVQGWTVLIKEAARRFEPTTSVPRFFTAPACSALRVGLACFVLIYASGSKQGNYPGIKDGIKEGKTEKLFRNIIIFTQNPD